VKEPAHNCGGQWWGDAVVWRRKIAMECDGEVITRKGLNGVRQLVLDGRKNNVLENLEVHRHIGWLENTASSSKKRVIGF
jgi:hypothetical protein